MTSQFKRLLLLIVLVSHPTFADEDDETEIQGIPEMNTEQRQSLGIVTGKAERRLLTDEIVLPGEITINAYRTSLATTRIRAQVVARHVRMGDAVKAGQKLVTLSSVEMADAQGQLLIADREWLRVQKLGRKVISEQRFIEAQVNYQQGIAKLLAYGMTKPQINALRQQGDASEATGNFDLLSQQDGTVIDDQFVLGQVVEPGQKLVEITDESVLWVEAQIDPETLRIVPGAVARVNTGNNQWLIGKVVQIHRKVDETTRTLPVRIEILNEDGLFYPGQFVKVGLQSATSHNVLAVPQASVTLLYGEQMVFVLNGDKLSPQLIKTGEIRNGWIEINAGLTEKDSIVTQGTFMLKSMLLKSQIGDAD